MQFIEDADSFDAVIDLIASGKADIGISKLSQTYARLRRVRFSIPYITLRHAMLFNRAEIAREANGQSPAAILQKFHGRIGLTAKNAHVEFATANFPDAAERHRTDTRTLQAYLGHRNIQHTVRYTELSPTRFKNLWRD